MVQFYTFLNIEKTIQLYKTAIEEFYDCKNFLFKSKPKIKINNSLLISLILSLTILLCLASYGIKRNKFSFKIKWPATKRHFKKFYPTLVFIILIWIYIQFYEIYFDYSICLLYNYASLIFCKKIIFLFRVLNIILNGYIFIVAIFTFYTRKKEVLNVLFLNGATLFILSMFGITHFEKIGSDFICSFKIFSCLLEFLKVHLNYYLFKFVIFVFVLFIITLLGQIFMYNKTFVMFVTSYSTSYELKIYNKSMNDNKIVSFFYYFIYFALLNINCLLLCKNLYKIDYKSRRKNSVKSNVKFVEN